MERKYMTFGSKVYRFSQKSILARANIKIKFIIKLICPYKGANNYLFIF